MRKVIYSMMVSLDGYMEGPNRDLDWPLIDEELHRFINDRVRQAGAFVYGRRMYETMASSWPTADRDLSKPGNILEFAQIWQQMPKIVFSRTLERVVKNTRLLKDDLAGEMARLKAQPGGDHYLGGADLASTLLPLGLIDEYQLYIHLVVLGGGTPMFPALNDRIALQLVETRRFDSGVVYPRYQDLTTV